MYVCVCVWGGGGGGAGGGVTNFYAGVRPCLRNNKW